MWCILEICTIKYLQMCLELIQDSQRPAYWVPDNEIKNCHVCQIEFGSKVRLHHCRACGNGVCDNCSPLRRHVPSRGWDYPVRVCNICNRKSGQL